MFEHSLLESAGTIRTSKSWTTTISFATQAAIVMAVILFIRFNPQLLRTAPIVAPIIAPTIKLTPPPLATQPIRVKASADAIAAPSPGSISRQVAAFTEGSVPSSDFSAFASSVASTAATSQPPGLATPNPIAKSTVTSGPLRISSGTIQANCISCPPPIYPVAAKAVRISGSVILAAVISARGTVENMQVFSGPPLLRNAALDAARNWRYKPTVLSGQPVEVQTEITVVFHLD